MHESNIAVQQLWRLWTPGHAIVVNNNYYDLEVSVHYSYLATQSVHQVASYIFLGDLAI